MDQPSGSIPVILFSLYSVIRQSHVPVFGFSCRSMSSVSSDYPAGFGKRVPPGDSNPGSLVQCFTCLDFFPPFPSHHVPGPSPHPRVRRIQQSSSFPGPGTRGRLRTRSRRSRAFPCRTRMHPSRRVHASSSPAAGVTGENRVNPSCSSSGQGNFFRAEGRAVRHVRRRRRSTAHDRGHGGCPPCEGCNGHRRLYVPREVPLYQPGAFRRTGPRRCEDVCPGDGRVSVRISQQVFSLCYSGRVR